MIGWGGTSMILGQGCTRVKTMALEIMATGEDMTTGVTMDTGDMTTGLTMDTGAMTTWVTMDTGAMTTWVTMDTGEMNTGAGWRNRGTRTSGLQIVSGH